MKDWLLGLEPRERLVVFGGSGVLLAMLLYLLVIEPVVQARQERRESVAALERELEWMRDAAVELQALGDVTTDRGGSDRPPYLAIDRALRDAGLTRPQTLEPIGADSARVEFETVAFDSLIRVLERLRARDGLRVARARFRRSAPGKVEAGVTLRRTR